MRVFYTAETSVTYRALFANTYRPKLWIDKAAPLLGPWLDDLGLSLCLFAGPTPLVIISCLEPKTCHVAPDMGCPSAPGPGYN